MDNNLPDQSDSDVKLAELAKDLENLEKETSAQTQTTAVPKPAATFAQVPDNLGTVSVEMSSPPPPDTSQVVADVQADKQTSPEVTKEPNVTSTDNLPKSTTSKGVNSNLALIVLGVVLFIVTAVGAVYLGSRSSAADQSTVPATSPRAPVASPMALPPVPDPTLGWTTYFNEGLGYSFKYPEDVEIGDERSVVPERSSIVLSRGGKKFTFGVDSDYLPEDVLNYLDTEAIGEIKAGEHVWLTYSLPEGYQDGGNTSADPIYALRSEIAGLLFTINVEGLEDVDPVLLLMLGTITGPQEAVKGEAVDCTDPRPEFCTEECIVNPPYICGSDGKSYCSTCAACGNVSVGSYVIQETACVAGATDN